LTAVDSVSPTSSTSSKPEQFNRVVTGVVNGGLAVGAFAVNTYNKCPCVKKPE
jgi:hypothetical protein